MDKRPAIIDLGTNTFHLLIAERQGANDFTILTREVIPVKIGAGGINAGHLKAEAYERGMAALRRFQTILMAYEATLKQIIGTSALRNADNAPNFLREAETLLNSPIELIEGDQEAEFIYYGVRQAVGLGEQPHLILDIGGGSVEFIVGNQDKIFVKQSIEIGAARLIERFPHDFPIQPEQKDALTEYIDQTLQPLWQELKAYPLAGLVGASGFFETFVNLHRYQVETNPTPALPAYYPLEGEIFNNIKRQILASTREELYAMPGMEAFRVEMMVVSTILLDLILKKTGIPTIYYSDYAVKEGALVKVLETR